MSNGECFSFKKIEKLYNPEENAKKKHSLGGNVPPEAI